MTEHESQSAKASPRKNEYVGFRCPAGWRETICQKAGTDNISEAVIRAVAAHYGLRYEPGDAGRRPKSFAVDVTTPHSAELVESVFAAYAQPWQCVKTKRVSAGVEIARTFVSCKAGDEVSNSEETGRVRGIELARAIAQAIDEAAAEMDDGES